MPESRDQREERLEGDLDDQRQEQEEHNDGDAELLKLCQRPNEMSMANGGRPNASNNYHSVPTGTQVDHEILLEGFDKDNIFVVNRVQAPKEVVRATGRDRVNTRSREGNTSNEGSACVQDRAVSDLPL